MEMHLEGEPVLSDEELEDLLAAEAALDAGIFVTREVFRAKHGL